MSQKRISSEEEVKAFLKELKELLTDHGFDVSRDLDILLKKRSESPIDPYTTANTLQALEFDKSDVLNQLLALNTSEYMETFIDDKDSTFSPFFAFAKSIKNKDVYVKVKLGTERVVRCFVFHSILRDFLFLTIYLINNTGDKKGVLFNE